MRDSFPSAEDFLEEMDRTRRADRRRRIINGLLFWIFAALITGVVVYAAGYIPYGLAGVVLILGLIVILIREHFAIRRYEMPDDDEEDEEEEEDE